MARTGRPPKPTHIKILEGNRGKRAINGAEPKPRLGIPPCPSHLRGEARKEWRRIVRDHDAVILARVDRAALSAHCLAWGRHVEAERKIAELGEVLETAKGYKYQNPWLAISNKALEQIKSFGAEFGLSPASRTRIKGSAASASNGEKDNPKNPARKYFGT
jgi:P27 family predicted phage terminase small subunit